jgi:carboxyl-terminal processing protease
MPFPLFRGATLLAALNLAMTAAGAQAAPTPDVSLLDLVEIEFGYTTLDEQYYHRVAPQQLLDGARTGIVAYLRSRGIADPRVGFMHPRDAAGRGAVPAIDQQIGRAILRYGARVDVRQLVYAAISGEAASLHDPYTVLFTPAELKGFTAALDGTAFGGVGIELAADPATGAWTIDDVFAGGPAARAGLAEGDRIVQIDGTPVAGLATSAVTALVRGTIGTPVTFTIERGGAELPAPIAVVRAAVTPPEVTARLLTGNVGYLRLRTFGPTAGRDVHAALRRLEARGARAIVFDLRGNGGGYETQAVHVASAFVPSGPVVAIQQSHGSRVVTNADGDALPARPLVVLVDGDSASGAELTAAAIRDRGIGTIVGTTTFGKGVVQSMFPLPDGAALKVTTARYFTPAGASIDGVGIVPDVRVTEPAGAQIGVPGSDAQLDRALELLRP